ncbi:P-loop NTPase fold protein [Tenacibaculum sp.]|uniref:P-loop NTPase fold protein n=1 Tax=Tenacibaculum sp. TaxID=1906242 RepID=UPI003AA96F20
MKENNYPVFLPGKAIGQDAFEGGAHERVSKVIKEIIINNKLEKKVIGLEGDWGAGKSNVVKLVEKELGDDYVTFIFDAWGNQEDLTRRSFLEQLISTLVYDKLLLEESKWRNIKKSLLSKVSEVSINKKSSIKGYWLFLGLSFLLFTVLSSFYNNILLEVDFLKDFEMASPWRALTVIYLIPSILLVISFIKALYSFSRRREEVIEKGINETERETLNNMIQVFQGKSIEEENIERIWEDEPSVVSFRKYYSEIESSLNDKGKKILIVFDNIDRIEDDKIKALWSSIHTFFADDTSSFTSWVIIPYDKKKLSKCFEDNEGFIEKTFSINFKITPPLVIAWESFMKEKLLTAFGEELINKDEIERIIKIFDLCSNEKVVRPRSIINYINEVVTLYKVWEEEVLKNEIKIEHLALFYKVKDKIEENPIENIISRTYLEKAKLLYDDVDLETIISMLFYGVKKDLADEVLLSRKLDEVIREGKYKDIELLSKHGAFVSYFIARYNKIPINQKHRGVLELFNEIEKVMPPHLMKDLWSELSKEILDVPIAFEEFREIHKVLLVKGSNNFNIIKKLVNDLSYNVNNEEKKQIIYRDSIMELERFVEGQGIDVNIFNFIEGKKHMVSPEVLLSFVTKKGEDYHKYRVFVEEEEIDSYFLHVPTLDIKEIEEGGILNYKEINHYMTELKMLSKDYSFEEIKNRLLRDIKKYYTDFVSAREGVGVLRKLFPSVGFIKVERNEFYSMMNSPKDSGAKEYIDLFCIALSNVIMNKELRITKRWFFGEFHNFSESEVADNIEYYLDYGDFLEQLLEDSKLASNKFLMNVFELVTNKNEREGSIDFNWVLKNFKQIKERVFNNNEVHFRVFLDKVGALNYTGDLELDSVPMDFCNYLDLGNSLVRTVARKSVRYIDNMTKEKVFKMLMSRNSDYIVFEKLIENKWLDKSLSDSFYEGYEEYLYSIAKGRSHSYSIEGIVENRIHFLANKSNLRRIFMNVKELLYEFEVNDFKLRSLFNGVFSYGSLDNDVNESMKKIIIPLMLSDKTFDIFLRYSKDLMLLFESSESYTGMLFERLIEKKDSTDFSDNEKMKLLLKRFNLDELKA